MTTHDLSKKDAAAIGARIKALRKKHGLTYSQLGAQLGWSLTIVHRLEKGARRLRVGQANRLAAHFGVPAAYIAFGIEPTPLSKEAKRLLDWWEKLTPEGQKAFLRKMK